MERESTSLIRKMKIKATMRHHLTLEIAKHYYKTSPSVHEDIKQLIEDLLV